MYAKWDGQEVWYIEYTLLLNSGYLGKDTLTMQCIYLYLSNDMKLTKVPSAKKIHSIYCNS